MSHIDIEEMLNEVITDIQQVGSEVLLFITENHVYKMYHNQDCCEEVYLAEVHGEFDDLIGSPLTMCECSEVESRTGCGSQTATFYRMATIKGYVTLRWFGESNGYYSESVDILKSDK